MTTTAEIRDEALGTEQEENQEEVRPLTIDEKIDQIDDEMQKLLENVWEMCRKNNNKANLDPSVFSPMFHQFVKKHAEQDRLFEQAEAEQLDKILAEYSDKLKPHALAYNDTLMAQAGRRLSSARIKFVTVKSETEGGEDTINIEITPILVDLPKDEDNEDE